MTNEFYGATIDAQRSINSLLALPATGNEQDWELELADPNRIEEMLQAVATHNLNYDERCALYLLIIASMEERNNLGCLDDNTIKKVKYLLNNDTIVRESMIFYCIENKQYFDDALIKKLLLR